MSLYSAGEQILSPSNPLSVAGPMNPTDQSQVNKRNNSLNYICQWIFPLSSFFLRVCLFEREHAQASGGGRGTSRFPAEHGAGHDMGS